jgi:protein associated with RNAse G/E
MKLTKFAFTAMVAALAVWTSSAQVRPGGYYRYEKVNFNLVVKQQALNYQGIGSGIWTVKTMRMGNKELLTYLAEAFHTSWPAGAHLAVLRDTRDYSSYPEIYVLDKDGNYLGGGSWGYYLNETNNAYFSVNCGFSVIAGKYAYGWPLTTYNVTHSHIISFQLYRIEDDPSVYTDLNFQGLDTEKYHQNMNGYTNSISMSDHADLSGDGLMNDTWTIVSGHVTIGGKWVDVF